MFHERNTAVHVSEHEGRAERRPPTPGELQAFFDAADGHVDRAAGRRRKGWLAAFRDATLFKVVYGRGLFSGVRQWAGGLTSRVCAAQRLMLRGYRARQVWCKQPGRRCPAGVSPGRVLRRGGDVSSGRAGIVGVVGESVVRDA